MDIKKRLFIVGSGLVSASDFTSNVKSLMNECEKIFCLEPLDYFQDFFGQHAHKCKSFDFVFDSYGDDRSSALFIVAEEIIQACRPYFNSVFILRGHPTIAVAPVQHLVTLCPDWLSISISPGISSLDWMLSDLAIDPTEKGLQIIGPHLVGELSAFLPVAILSPGYANTVKRTDRLIALTLLAKGLAICYGYDSRFIIYSRSNSDYTIDTIEISDLIVMASNRILGDKMILGPTNILGITNLTSSERHDHGCYTGS